MTVRAFYDVPAPAKLNLFLHVVGRRADGYHLLQSLFVLVDWCDRLHFELRGDGALARHDLSAELPPDDLCLRAARALQRAGGTSLGVDISIDKQLPAGAGMGGGSSDAASTLVALNRLWNLHWPRPRLMALGLALGADVPFFLGRGAALVEGIGERLTPAAVPPQRFAVVKPPAGIDTKAIFESPLTVRDSPCLESAAILEGLARDGEEGFLRLMQASRNDLQAAAGAQCNDIAMAAERLAHDFGNSRMTGSGSAVFAVATRKSASSAAGDAAGGRRIEITDNLPSGRVAEGWTTKMCQSLNVHPLAEWVAG